MKKLTKISIIVAVVFAVVGTVMLSIGIGMGAQPEDYLQLSIDENFIMGIGNEEAPQDMAEKISSRESFSAQEVEKLLIEAGEGEIRVYPDPDADEIVCFSNEDSVCRIEDGTLRIVDRAGNSYLKLELHLPVKQWEEVILSLGACEVYIEEIDAKRFSLKAGAGSVRIERLLSHESGNLQIGTGVLAVLSYEGERLKMNCGTGSMAVTLAGTREDYNYELKCGVGSIYLEGNRYSGVGTSTSIDNHARGQIEAQCGMGEINITF